MTEKDRKKLWDIATHLRIVAEPGRQLSGKTLEEYAEAIDEIAGRDFAPAGEKVRVRAVVVVDHEGNWTISADSKMDDEEKRVHSLMGWSRGGYQLAHFIEADVPLPVPQTIPAEVSQ